MKRTIRFTLNGEPASVSTDGERMLLWVLRTELGLTGTKYGCGEGYCGACTVLIGDEPVRSCQFPVKRRRGEAGHDDRGAGQGRRAPSPAGGFREA